MTIAAATLNGTRVTSARVQIPAWGIWYADVAVDGEVALTGHVTLKVADLTLLGTVLSGGPSKGRSDYRLVGGAGGWGKTIRAWSYADDAGVKVSKVISEAAELVGETFVSQTTERVGSAWTRPAGPASRALQLLAPANWYVGEDGITRLGRRPAVPLTGTATHGVVDRARGTVTLAAESIAAILPGAVVDGLEAVDVQHVISAKDGLRSTLWGRLGAGTTSRRVEAYRAIAAALDPDRAFRGVSEYRVVTTSGKRLNLQPVRVSTGMPDLLRVRAWPGVAGCEADVALGSRVLVGFIDSDPSRPVVLAFEDADGQGFVPTSITLAKGTKAVARVDDQVTITADQLTAAGANAGGTPIAVTSSIVASITSGSSKVRCG